MSKKHFSAGSNIAVIDFDFDYSKNDKFQLPDWPYFPGSARPYDYNNIRFSNITAGINKVVGSHWGRVITDLDMTEKGAMKMQGQPLWGDVHIVPQVDTYPDPRMASGFSAFGRIHSLNVVYSESTNTKLRNSPVLIAGNVSHIRFGIILLPIEQVKQMSPDVAHDCFGGGIVHDFNMHFADVAIPFPFYVEGVKAEDFSCFDNVSLAFNFSSSHEYAIMFVLLNNAKDGKTYLQVPNAPLSILMGTSTSRLSSASPYGQLAERLENAATRGLIKFGSLTTSEGEEFNVETAANRNLLITAFSTPDPLPERVHFEKVDTHEVLVPSGLDELPLLPDGKFTYLCDFQGIVYISDVLHNKVMMPYQVFDLINLRKIYRTKIKSLDEAGLEPNEEVTEYFRQIGLVEALFKHQAALLEGTAYAYEALMN